MKKIDYAFRSLKRLPSLPTPDTAKSKSSTTFRVARTMQNLWMNLDQWVADLIHTEKTRHLNTHLNKMIDKFYESGQQHTKFLNPEEDVKKLINNASSLEDIWQFFLKRLKNTSQPDLICFSMLDESEDFLKVHFLSVEVGENRIEPVLISLTERNNHLIQACIRKDTTFTANIHELGRSVLTALFQNEPHEHEELNIFSIPFIAKNRAIALITLGFHELDAFSQAKLSYIYTIRDQIAQLVWNLTLQDRMKTQAQIDNLTGLLSYSYFQKLLEAEMQKAEAQQTSLTTMILDINNIHEINRRYGHQVGDEAICHLASTVRRLIRGLDTVARFGGDEVVVLLPESDAKTADEIANRFIQGISQRLPENLSDLSISIGYATYPSDSHTRDRMLQLAEQALHLAKFKGAKTGESTGVAYREVNRLNEKTVLEVFASHIAKKYNNHSIFDELIRRIEHKPIESSVDISPVAEDLMLETIGSLAGALEAKDRYTRGHSQAVANYAVALSHALQLGQEEVEQIRLAAFLHDIGKIGIPESILCKAGHLNEKEWAVMKQHPVIGAQQILAPVSALKDIIPMVEFHHENWNGTGYPLGLKGDEIPLGARIISIVDAFHGITSDRPYRKALPIQEACRILEGGAGTRWDPELIQLFLQVVRIASPKQPPSFSTSEVPSLDRERQTEEEKEEAVPLS